jgi:hypothetical protein
VDAFSAADEPPVLALFPGRVEQARVPGNWGYYGSAVGQVDCEGVARHIRVDRASITHFRWIAYFDD